MKVSESSLLTGLVAGATLAVAVTAGLGNAQAQQRFTTIGTGGVTGVYYPLGGAICRLMNQGRERHGIRCSAESTGASIFNLNALREGELEFGVAQSDWQYHAYRGSSAFSEAGAHADLRSVFSVHPEPFTVVVRADAGIERFEQIRGKRVNVGNAGSGTRGTVEVLMAEYGWTMDDFSLASELTSREQAAALCDNRVDVILFAVGHPSGSIQEPIATCGAKLISVTGPVVDRLIEENPYYFQATIPAGMYPGQSGDISTFGVGATITSANTVPDEVVYELVKAVFEDLENFKTMHPAFAVLNKEQMVSSGLTAPLHAGARRYFREVGLLSE